MHPVVRSLCRILGRWRDRELTGTAQEQSASSAGILHPGKKEQVMDNTSSNVNKTIMIVDDEPFFRGLLRDMLSKEGFTVVAEASDGDEAVEMYRSFRPDLTLMDIFMAGKNGIEAIQEIVSLDKGANVVICCGMGYDDDVAFAMKSGAKGVIYKPFYPNEVMEIVTKALRKE
jgi:two-component system chemotaxis response regulator CheY